LEQSESRGGGEPATASLRDVPGRALAPASRDGSSNGHELTPGSAAPPDAATGDLAYRSRVDALSARLAFEDLLTDVASTFLHRPAHEVNAGVRDVLARIGTFAEVDRSFVYLCHERREVVELLHEWTAPDVEAARGTERIVPRSELATWLATLETEGVVYIPKVGDLDDTWEPERRRLEGVGARSVLAVPIADQGRMAGFVGFDLVGPERLWSDDHIGVLSSTAGIIAQALARSDAEQRFGLAFDRAPLGMALHGPDGRHIQVNPAYCELLGHTEEELLGASVLAFIDPRDRHRLVARHRHFLEGYVDQLVIELRFPRGDGGDLVWGRVHSAAVRSDDGTLRYTVSHVEDISERVRTDAELRASEERYRTLVENFPAAILRYDRELRIVYMSDHVARVSGLDADVLSVDPGRLLVRPEDAARWLEQLTLVFETGRRVDSEWEVPSDGRSQWFQSRAVPELDERGEVEYVLVVNTDITALKRSEEELAHQALHDPLTGLANRALLVEFLDRAVERELSPWGPAVIFVDLDRFKLVNDSLGHRAGDELLQAVAERLSAVVRPGDLIARLGGDEFVVVLEQVATRQEALDVAQRIRTELTRPIVVSGDEIVMTGSIGIALPDGAGADADGLLRDADAAMYLAKANGRNRAELFDTGLRTRATEKLQMEAALRRAIEGSGLHVHYQPELDLRTGMIVGFEALVRWEHPHEGLLTAGAFIELAEETGLILDLGAFVLVSACRQAGDWARQHPDRRVTLRVNLSGRQFAQPDLVAQVTHALESGGMRPASLCLEITETALMADPVSGLRVLNDLRELGIELAIDDFGTGYSSLAYLKRFPVDVLKIDRSFVAGLGQDPDDTSIATAIISLARSLGLRVVAEGVETRLQLDELRRLGCDGAQGFLFARPVPAVDAWALPTPFPLDGGAPAIADLAPA
jgi:diguanylate cyclase (GGDEF)-like protein/PAS domain S-box-containing protein